MTFYVTAFTVAVVSTIAFMIATLFIELFLRRRTA